MIEQQTVGDSRRAEAVPGPFLPVLMAWIFPGAGHFRIGRPWPGLFILAGVLPLFVAGMAMTGWENVSPERHPFYFALHAMAAGPAGVGALLTRDVIIDRPYPMASVGELYTAVAGLLNLVAVADVWARCRHGDPDRATEEGKPLSAAALVDGPDGPDGDSREGAPGA